MKTPSPAQKRAMRDMVLSFLCAVAFFSSVFARVVPFYAALGLAMLFLTGFVVLFNRGYASWEASKGTNVEPRT